MPDGTVSYREWMAYYRAALAEHGVAPDDAHVAAALGAEIIAVHQMCYGIASTVPVDYVVLPEPGEEALASCHGRRFGNEEPGYRVYPTGLHALMAKHAESYGGLVPFGTLLQGVAVHEVRHHVQDREAATLRMFNRDRLAGTWSDPQVAVVAVHMHLQYLEDERCMRAGGTDEETIRWKLSPVEYDADIVERLFIHRFRDLAAPAALARFVRMDAPYAVP